MIRTFLSADWRKLAIVNYSIDKKLLYPYLPYKTEIDSWQGVCYVSLVGFMFLNTLVKGMRIPFHTHFEEVNLRFYVRYKDTGEWKRGVVFIKEIVPKPALTFVANTIYKENYQTMPMSHSWQIIDDTLCVEYRWKKDKWHSIKVKSENKSVEMKAGSEEEFITEHYWGYTKINDRTTSEYGVKHPKWQVYPIKSYLIDVNFGSLYGQEYGYLGAEIPKSVFLAEGSEIKVEDGRFV